MFTVIFWAKQRRPSPPCKQWCNAHWFAHDVTFLTTNRFFPWTLDTRKGCPSRSVFLLRFPALYNFFASYWFYLFIWFWMEIASSMKLPFTWPDLRCYCSRWCSLLIDWDCCIESFPHFYHYHYEPQYHVLLSFAFFFLHDHCNCALFDWTCLY